MEPIVVGTDGSERADLAVEWAAEEALRRRRPLRIVHAAEHWEYDLPFTTAPGLSESLTATGERILAQAAEHATKTAPGLEVTTGLVFEPPARALRAEADRAYEVVVGHRGLGGFAGLLLGSTGLRVAGHAPGPVIIVRGEIQERRGEVLAGVAAEGADPADPADEAAVVLRYAFEAAQVRGARVRVLHAWRVPPPLSDFPEGVRHASDTALQVLSELVRPWREGFPDVPVVEQAVPGHPVRELAARSAEADLVVVGSRGRRGLHGACLGSVGHGVVHHADCPVAVVRPRA